MTFVNKEIPESFLTAEEAVCIGGPLDGNVVPVGSRQQAGEVIRAIVPRPSPLVSPFSTFSGCLNEVDQFFEEYELKRIVHAIPGMRIGGVCWAWKFNKDSDAQLMMKIIAAEAASHKHKEKLLLSRAVAAFEELLALCRATNLPAQGAPDPFFQGRTSLEWRCDTAIRQLKAMI